MKALKEIEHLELRYRDRDILFQTVFEIQILSKFEAISKDSYFGLILLNFVFVFDGVWREISGSVST